MTREPVAAPGPFRYTAGIVGDVLAAVGLALCVPLVILAIGIPVALCVQFLLTVVGMF